MLLCIYTLNYFCTLGLDEDINKGLQKSKSFLDRVWSTMSHFPTTICDRARLQLSEHIPPEVI